MTYRDKLKGDPLAWLLEPDPTNPGVRLSALRDILGKGAADPKVQAASADAMKSGPVPLILGAQEPGDSWVTASEWHLSLLAELGADGQDPRVRLACEFLINKAQASSGGLSHNGTPSGVVHCMNGILVHALLSFGYGGDLRLDQALAWAARSILGRDTERYYKSGTTGPGFRCAVNWGSPCAWGAVKELRALALVSAEERTPLITEAIEYGVGFLLERDLSKADYPVGEGKISPYWFKFGFPLSYHSDILEALDVLVALGYGSDPRLVPAVEFVLSKQDALGRWKLEHSLNGKMWVDVEQKGQPSKWVTLRALRVLKDVFGA